MNEGAWHLTLAIGKTIDRVAGLARGAKACAFEAL